MATWHQPSQPPQLTYDVHWDMRAGLWLLYNAETRSVQTLNGPLPPLAKKPPKSGDLQLEVYRGPISLRFQWLLFWQTFWLAESKRSFILHWSLTQTVYSHQVFFAAPWVADFISFWQKLMSGSGVAAVRDGCVLDTVATSLSKPLHLSLIHI